MNYIFLDIDGVLRPLDLRGLCAQRLDLFAEVAKLTDSDVVLSSTWRLPHCREQRMRLCAELYKRGVKLAGMTPVLNQPIGFGEMVSGVKRGEEIMTWLHKNLVGPQDRFVILDDDPNDEMGELKPHLVKCDGYKGLTEELCREIARRLTG